MLNSGDPGTIPAIRALRDLATDKTKPIVLWYGAGVSRWCGYLGWKDLADSLHSKFLRVAGSYDKALAASLLAGKNFPEFFRVCRNLSPQLFNSALVGAFGPPRSTPVYQRFLDLTNKIKPLHVITTNVDEALEKGLPGAVTVQRSDFERTQNLIQNGSTFVSKPHGTIGSVETTVFTSDDYNELVLNGSFIELIERIFSDSIVVFIGYGLGDEYLIRTIEHANSGKPIFGTGPHFAVLPARNDSLPSSISQILYLPDDNGDHRSSLVVLDIIRAAQTDEAARMKAAHTLNQPEKPSGLQSAYYIADFVPPGTWNSHQSIEARNPGHEDLNVIVGQGFSQPELPSSVSTAMHDLTVGLICFDLVYLPLAELGKAHGLLGNDRFWRLVASDALRFVHAPSIPAVIFEHKSRWDDGGIGAIHVNKTDGSGPIDVEDQIKKFLGTTAIESQAAQQFLKLEQKVVSFPVESSQSTPELVRGCLLNPSIQASLGLSDAFIPNAIPRWNVFPVLRLAHLISVGRICHHFGIPATRIAFGGDALIGPAFGVAAAGDWADETASYVLNGNFNTDIGDFIFHKPSILEAILQFRETQDGISFRSAIREMLATNEGAEFRASVNAGLKRNVPAALLEKARNQLAGLLTAQGSKYHPTAAIWNNTANADSLLGPWKARSLSILQECCREKGIGLYDLCPCGSREKLRFCCHKALRP